MILSKKKYSGGCAIMMIAILVCILLQKRTEAQNHFDLIFVEFPADRALPRPSDGIIPVMDRYLTKSRIVALSAGSEKKVILTPEFYAACDPAVAYNGRTVVFAGKKNVTDKWQIWQMNRDGSGKKQITSSARDCIMPVYAGNRFYLDDPAPTPQIIYTGIVYGMLDNMVRTPLTALYGTDTTGRSVDRLTFNLYNDFGPDILPNGQIVFSSWQPVDKGRLALLNVNLDGTDLMPYYGNHKAPVYKEMVRISAGDEYTYFIESDSADWFGGGDIAAVSQKRPLHSYRKIAAEDDGAYSSPCPLPNGDLIVSYRPTKNDVFALYALDPQKGIRKGILFAEKGWHLLDTRVLAARPKAKGRSDWLIPGTITGVFYCLDIYRSDLPAIKNISRDAIKFVRIIEGLSQPDIDSVIRRRMADEPEFDYYRTPRRVLATVPVEDDGSFQIRVPAEIPLTFQLLNRDRIKILEQKSWTWVKGNENRGCIGCHEDPEMSPPNILVDAVRKTPVDLTTGYKEKSVIGFRNQIAPLLISKCSASACHEAGAVPPDFVTSGDQNTKDRIAAIYSALIGPAGSGQDRSYVERGSAANSRLVQVLLSGKKSLRGAAGPAKGSVAHENFLTEQEKLTLIEWIDTGAPLDTGISDTSDSGKN
jgi:hypothetical protein